MGAIGAMLNGVLQPEPFNPKEVGEEVFIGVSPY
jgi:tetrahydrodipicolinate N-succinyltransferase